MALLHDAYVQGASQNTGTLNAAGGASIATTAFGTQTRWIRLCVLGATVGSGVRYQVGDGTITGVNLATLGTLLPVNWVEIVACNPGQKVAAISNDTVATLNLNVTELS